MRNRLIGLLVTMALASTMATAGCGSSSTGDSDTEGTGASSNTGGATAMGGSTTGVGGSSTGGATSTGVTTLAGTTVLNTLAEGEATQLCDEIWAYFARVINTETFCKYKGLSYATSSSAPTEEQLRSNCSSTETSCLADPTAAWAGNPGCSGIPADCAATVADYSACIMDTAAGFTQAVNGMATCDVLTSDGTTAVWDLKSADRLPSCMLTNCTTLWPPDPKNF